MLLRDHFEQNLLRERFFAKYNEETFLIDFLFLV